MAYGQMSGVLIEVLSLKRTCTVTNDSATA